MRSQGQLLNIQILRAFAAGIVVLGHAGQEMAAIASRTGQVAPSMGGINFGWGVDIFFVISGFIMIHTSADHFGKPGAAREFLVRRLIRIVPLYWLVTTTLIVGAIFAPRLLNVPIGDWQHILSSYLFIPDARANGEIRPVVALGWTLNYEMFFYVFFALSMLLPLRKGICAIFLLFGLFMTIGAFGPSGNVPLDFWTSSLLGEFLFGVVIGLVARNSLRLSTAKASILATAGLAAFIALGPLWSFGDGLPDIFKSGIPAAMLVAAGALGTDVRSVKITKWLGFLGNASYALYLVHPFAIRPLREIWASKIGATLPLTLYLLAALALAMAVAIALHLMFERPVTKGLNAWRKRKRTGLRDPATMTRHAA